MKIVIIGAGVTGMFSAYYLSKAGHEVTLIDMGTDMPATSIFNAGLITPSTGISRNVGITEILGSYFTKGPIHISLIEVLRNPAWFATGLRKGLTGYELIMRKLGMQSLRFYDEFFETEQISADQTEGILGLFSKVSDAKTIANEISAQFVDEFEISHMGFQGFHGGIYMKDEVSINPTKLVSELRRILAGSVNLILGRVASFQRKGSEITSVTTQQEMISGDFYVIAAGSWSNQLAKQLGYDTKVLPARGLVMLFETGEHEIVSSAALLEEFGMAVSQHDINTLRLTSFFQMVGFRETFGDEQKKWMLDTARNHIRKFTELRLVREGVGYRPCTPDQLPVIGLVPGIRNGYIASGNCRLGITLAPATGNLIKDMIVSRITGVATDNTWAGFDPSRFRT